MASTTRIALAAAAVDEEEAEVNVTDLELEIERRELQEFGRVLTWPERVAIAKAQRAKRKATENA